MSDQQTDTATARRTRGPTRARQHIKLPDGDVLIPRDEFATELGISERGAARLNLETLYIGGVAFVRRDASLKEVAERARRRHEPRARTMRRGRKPTP